MKKRGKATIPVKGGWIVRDAKTGRFSEVLTRDGGSHRLTEESSSSVGRASAKRSAALKRLADR